MSAFKATVKAVIKAVIHSVFDDGGGLVPPPGYTFVVDKFGNYVVNKTGQRVIARKIP